MTYPTQRSTIAPSPPTQTLYLSSHAVVFQFGCLQACSLKPRKEESQWGQDQGCFVTRSQQTYLALKAQERLHLDTRQKRSKVGSTNMPVVWSKQQVTSTEPHILYGGADAVHPRGYHKPNKYCHRPFPWSRTETKALHCHLKQSRACSLCSWPMAFCPVLLVMS